MSERIKAIIAERDRAAQGFGNRHSHLNLELLASRNIRKYKAVEGNNMLMIIPPTDPGCYFGLMMNVHYDVGAARDSFICPLDTWRERCPICERRRQFEAQGILPQNQLWKMAPSRRYLYFVLNAANTNDGMFYWEVSKKGMEAFTAICQNPMTGQFIDISDMTNGKTLYFHRSGTGMTNTNYTGWQLLDRPSLDPGWSAYVPPFDQVIVKASYEEIAESLGSTMPAPAMGPMGMPGMMHGAMPQMQPPMGGGFQFPHPAPAAIPNWQQSPAMQAVPAMQPVMPPPAAPAFPSAPAPAPAPAFAQAPTVAPSTPPAGPASPQAPAWPQTQTLANPVTVQAPAADEPPWGGPVVVDVPGAQAPTPVVPQVHQPGMPQAPQVPQMPQAPQVPQMPQAPQVPQMAQSPQQADADMIRNRIMAATQGS